MGIFYSILYGSIRPAVDEKVSIALFMSDGINHYFRHSPEKFASLKQIMPSVQYKGMKSIVLGLEHYIKGDGHLPINLMPDYQKEKPYLSKAYFSYLNKYSNNIVLFSNVYDIDIELNQKNFDDLFNLFVYSGIEDKNKNHTINSLVQTKKSLIKKIENHVNVEIELNITNIPTIEIPTKVWFIGKNDRIVMGEAVEFDHNITHVKNALRNYMYLIDRLDSSKSEAEYFLVGKEPSKEEENHKIWDDIRNLSKINYVDASEIERIDHYMEEHNVMPLITKE